MEVPIAYGAAGASTIGEDGVGSFQNTLRRPKQPVENSESNVTFFTGC